MTELRSEMKNKLSKIETLCSGIRTSNDLIHNELLKMSQDITNLRSRSRNLTEAEKDQFNVPDFPFRELDKLTDFDEKLQHGEELKGTFTRYLKNLGGVTYKNAIQLILSKVLSPELGMLYSMRGRNAKMNFGSLAIYKCITGL